MKKKKTHTSPMEYRVRYKVNGAVEESVQYYNIFHSSEALDFLAHTFRQGHIHGQEKLTIIAVEEYNRFSDRWEDRTNKAVEHSQVPEVYTEDQKVFINQITTITNK